MIKPVQPGEPDDADEHDEGRRSSPHTGEMRLTAGGASSAVFECRMTRRSIRLGYPSAYADWVLVARIAMTSRASHQVTHFGAATHRVKTRTDVMPSRLIRRRVVLEVGNEIELGHDAHELEVDSRRH